MAKDNIIGTMKLSDIEKMRIGAKQEGRREVVDWIRQGDTTRPIYWAWNMKPGQQVIQIKLDAFLAKLKEWGIE